MTVEVVGVSEASAIRTAKTEPPEVNIANLVINGEMVWSDDRHDFADLTGKNSPLAAQGMTLKVQKGDHEGKPGWHAWAVPIGQE
jgi:hypothetical protein